MSEGRQRGLVSIVFLLSIFGFAFADTEYYPQWTDNMNRSPKKHSMHDMSRQTNNGSFLDKLVTDSSHQRNPNTTDTTVSDDLEKVSELVEEFSHLREKSRKQKSVAKTEKKHSGPATTTEPFHTKHSKHGKKLKKLTHKEKSKRLGKAIDGFDGRKWSTYKVRHRLHSKEIPLETDIDLLRHHKSSRRNWDKYRSRSNKSIRKNYKQVSSESEDTKPYRNLQEGDLSPENVTQAAPILSSTIDETEQLAEDEVLESLRQMHTELIKEKILRLLHLDEPPEVPKTPLPEFPKPIRSSLLNITQSDEPKFREMDHLNAPQAVIFAEDELLPCPRDNAKCVFFMMGKIERQEVISAKLWVYKQYDSMDHYNHTFVIYELEQSSENSTKPQLRKVVGSLETGIKKGWMKFDLRDTVSFWAHKPHRNNGLQILCKTCKTGPGRVIPVATSAQVRPVLVVKFGQPHSRSARADSNVCHSGNTICCRQPLNIDFKAINWEHWIVFPKSFQTSYCRGTCQRPHRMPYLLPYHSKMIMAANTNPLPCCAPIRMREVSVLVRNGLQYTKENLELKVTQCGCAT